MTEYPVAMVKLQNFRWTTARHDLPPFPLVNAAKEKKWFRNLLEDVMIELTSGSIPNVLHIGELRVA